MNFPVLGIPGGVFVFFEGRPIGKPGQYIFLPQRVEFGKMSKENKIDVRMLQNPKPRQHVVIHGVNPNDYRMPYLPAILQPGII